MGTQVTILVCASKDDVNLLTVQHDRDVDPLVGIKAAFKEWMQRPGACSYASEADGTFPFKVNGALHIPEPLLEKQGIWHFSSMVTGMGGGRKMMDGTLFDAIKVIDDLPLK
jgi:hypothetical protein